MIEFRSELGAVAAERLQLRFERVTLTIFFVPPMDRGLKVIDCRADLTGRPVKRRLVPILPHANPTDRFGSKAASGRRRQLLAPALNRGAGGC
jgi:hypothetical protein